MNLNSSINIRVLNIDVRSEINPTNVVLYQDSLNTYKFIIKLIDNGTYFVIPDTTKLVIKINGVEVPNLDYQIVDKYRGTIHLNLNKSYFVNNDKLINSSVSQIITLEMYSESTFGSHQYIVTIPVTVVTGIDDGSQNGDSGTINPEPELPSPAWNLTKNILPPTEDSNGDGIPDDDVEVETYIFDGGSFF